MWRNDLAGGLAGIRAYLLTGDEAFRRQFEQLWEKNDRRFADLGERVELLKPGQRAAYDKSAEARSAFAPLPPAMFEIRASAKLNMANWTLVNEAAPRGGGMVANQGQLLKTDAATVATQIDELTIIELVLLIVGLVICVVVIVFSNRATATPVIALRAAVEEVRAGGACAQRAGGQARRAHGFLQTRRQDCAQASPLGRVPMQIPIRRRQPVRPPD